MIIAHNNIFQTHKSIEYINSIPKLRFAVKSWLKKTSEFKYFFYDDNKCDKFMEEIVGGKIYDAYKRLPLKVMKADLWRYCIIYEYGGIYADTDTICKIDANLFLNDALLTIVPENNVHLCQWVFSAPPKSPILREIINLSVKRILEIKEIKGEHIIHHLTGPGVFTDGIEKYLNENGYPIFSNRLKYFNYPLPKILRVFNHSIFHKFMVIHLYTGHDYDGWLRERDKYLK